ALSHRDGLVLLAGGVRRPLVAASYPSHIPRDSKVLSFRLGEAAELLGVSPDTVRRWIDDDRLEGRRTSGGQRLVDGAALARLAVELAGERQPGSGVRESARNRFRGLVTRVTKDQVLAAASLTDVMPDLVRAFRRDHRITVAAAFGGSQHLAAQIAAAGPGDVFVAADDDTMGQARASGRTRAPIVAIARNRLEIAVQ